MGGNELLDILDLHSFWLRGAHQIANGKLGDFHGNGRAVQGCMREQPVDSAMQVSSMRPNGTCNISDNGARNLKTWVHQFCRGDAGHKNLDPQLFVQRTDLDAKPASQT